MIELKHNCIMPKDYLDLRVRSGNKPCKELHAVGAIKNSMFTTGLYQDGMLIAFGRVCGDAYLQLTVCDIMVDLRYQSKKLEAIIVKDIEDFLREAVNADTSVLVMASAEIGEIFARFGYKYFDEDFVVTMER